MSRNCTQQKSCFDCELEKKIKSGSANTTEIHNVIIFGEVESCKRLAQEILLNDIKTRN